MLSLLGRRLCDLSSRCYAARSAGAHVARFSPLIRAKLLATQSSVVPPKEARVVVCGGGAVGCSVAYHLAKQGIQDVLLIEQGRYCTCIQQPVLYL